MGEVLSNTILKEIFLKELHYLITKGLYPNNFTKKAQIIFYNNVVVHK